MSPNGLVTYNCRFSTVLAYDACSEAFRISVSRFSVGCNNESPPACGMSRCFCVININCSGSRSICSSSSAILGVGSSYSVSYHWQIRQYFQSKLLANMLLMNIFLLWNVPRKWELPFILSSTVQATVALSLEMSGGKYDT